MVKFIFVLAVLFLFVPCLFADPIEVEVLDREVLASITVADTFHINLHITFEDVIGLNSESLVITATQINPLDIALLNRIGSQTLFSIPAQLPVLVNITPSATSTLSFTGAYEIELSTSNLTFDPKYRIFTAPNGGYFEDITTFSGIGSYRVRGTSGDFSDFLIISDLRTLNSIVSNKYTKLQTSLSSSAGHIDPEMFGNLQEKLDASKASYQAGSDEDAADHLEEFINLIKNDNGQSVPNTYRANDPNTRNIAGELRKKAATLIFSLRL